MTEILDDLNPVEPKQSGYIFTVISVINAIITPSIIYYVVSSFTFTVKDGFQEPSVFLSWSILLFLVTGIVFTYFSFARKERFKIIRWIAGVFNIFMLIGSIALALFVNYAVL